MICLRNNLTRVSAVHLPSCIISPQPRYFPSLQIEETKISPQRNRKSPTIETKPFPSPSTLPASQPYLWTAAVNPRAMPKTKLPTTNYRLPTPYPISKRRELTADKKDVSITISMMAYDMTAPSLCYSGNCSKEQGRETCFVFTFWQLQLQGCNKHEAKLEKWVYCNIWRSCLRSQVGDYSGSL